MVAILCIVFMTGLAAAAAPAEKLVDFSGSWALDTKGSEIELPGPGIQVFSNGPTIGGGIPGDSSRGNGGNPTRGVESRKLLLDGWMDLRLRIVQTDKELELTRQFLLEGEDKTVVQKLALDGSQCINLSANGRDEFVSRVHFLEGRLINSGTQVQRSPGLKTEITVKEEYSLSKNGKKLTIKTMSATPDGIIKSKQIFIRQWQRQP